MDMCTTLSLKSACVDPHCPFVVIRDHLLTIGVQLVDGPWGVWGIERLTRVAAIWPGFLRDGTLSGGGFAGRWPDLSGGGVLGDSWAWLGKDFKLGKSVWPI